MPDPVIRVDGLAKRYPLGGGAPYGLLSEKIGTALKSPWQRLLRRPDASPPAGAGAEDPWLWALRDVSFEVAPGEVMGIVGRNGAGKSTLLKILARITTPTAGRAEIVGRVASLLEVGTGFHPEFTGRENVYLNGAILGLSRHAIRKQFDDIVAFAELTRFIDTPVKFYSSGMVVRLGFAVSAHLLADIVIIDEVLAVGDLAFREKCEDVIHRLPATGRTVLVVSHNSETIRRLADRCLYLEEGRVKQVGKSDEVLQQYHRDVFGEVPGRTVQTDSAEAETVLPRFPLVIENAAVSGPGVVDGMYLLPDEPVRLAFDLVARAEVPAADIRVAVVRDPTVLSVDDSPSRLGPLSLAPGQRRRFVIDYPAIPLVEGHCAIRIRVRRDPATGSDRPISGVCSINLMVKDATTTRGHVVLAQSWREVDPAEVR